MTTKLVAALVATVLAASLTLTSAEAGGCHGGFGGFKAFRSYANLGFLKKKSLASVQRRREHTLPAAKPKPEKSESKLAAADETPASNTTTANAETEVAEAKTTGCTKFVPAIGASVEVECPR